jgi:hypothetical protein
MVLNVNSSVKQGYTYHCSPYNKERKIMVSGIWYLRLIKNFRGDPSDRYRLPVSSLGARIRGPPVYRSYVSQRIFRVDPAPEPDALPFVLVDGNR